MMASLYQRGSGASMAAISQGAAWRHPPRGEVATGRGRVRCPLADSGDTGRDGSHAFRVPARGVVAAEVAFADFPKWDGSWQAAAGSAPRLRRRRGDDPGRLLHVLDV